MNAFDVLGDPVRRRIRELLAEGERAEGEVTAAVREEFGISQPTVSQHLRVLREHGFTTGARVHHGSTGSPREHGFTTVRAEGTRRLYAVDPAPLREIDGWLERYRRIWSQPLDALTTELARGKRERRGNNTDDARRRTLSRRITRRDNDQNCGDQRVR